MTDIIFNRDAKEDRPCPNCQKPVTLKVADLLDGKPIICHHCGLQMDTSEISKELVKIKKQIKSMKWNSKP